MTPTLTERLRAAEALLDSAPERATDEMLELYVEGLVAVGEHDVVDGVELALQSLASDALLAKIEARAASLQGSPQGPRLSQLSEIVARELKGRS